MKHDLNRLVRFTLLFGFVLLRMSAYAQYDHFSGVFSGTRIINGHSLETRQEGELEMLISHRFGRINQGGYDLFGLDQASIRLGFEYSLWNGFMVGVGRSSFEKTYDGFVKLRLFRQRRTGRGMPFAATYLASVAYRTLRNVNPVSNAFPSSRLFYTHQLLIGGRIGDRFSWQLAPTIVHRNLVETEDEPHDVFSMGFATRIDMTKSIALILELHRPFSSQLLLTHNPSMAVGFDIQTGGHVFQLHFTNSRGMIEKAFITETTGSWRNSDIHIGFNITRIFKLRGRWY